MSKRLPAVVVGFVLLLCAHSVFAQAYATRLRRQATQSIPTGTVTKIGLDTVDYDVGGISNITTSKVTIASAGKYHLRAAWYSTITAGTRCFVYVFVNGGRKGIDFRVADSFGNCTASIEEVLNLNVGDTVEMYVYHESGAAINTYGGTVDDANPILTVTAFSGAAGNGSSQWTTSSSNIYFNGGNVGIGTATPISPLYVQAANDGPAMYIYNSNPALTSSMGLLQIQAARTSNTSFALFNVLFGSNGTTGSGSSAFYVRGDGRVGVGTMSPASKLHVAGDVTVDGNIAARYQDVAEWVTSKHPLDAGTVVVVDAGERNLVDASQQSYDTKVVGVVSAQPGVVLGEAGDGKVLVAQSGRVRVKVDASFGSIAAGDLLVTSPIAGVAMRSTPVDIGGTTFHRPGTLLGKALEPLTSGQGEILVLLTLQ